MVGSLLQIQITELVSSRKCRKIISHECELAFCYQFFAAGFLWIGISHIFLLKPLKPVFLYLKSKFPLNLKRNYQWFNEIKRPFKLFAITVEGGPRK
jgi:hypothetical protein